MVVYDRKHPFGGVFLCEFVCEKCGRVCLCEKKLLCGAFLAAYTGR